MAVVGFEVTRRERYEDGCAFGETGAYECIDGTLRYAVDPAHPANAAIVDLARAPRAADGRVHFSGDVCLLQPLDAARGNRRALVELPNRGRKLLPGLFNRAAREAVPSARIDPGDGFLFRHGWTVAWVGWQWDVIRSDALMGLEAPPALENGQPVTGQTIVRFQPNVLHHTHLLADRVHQPYPAADPDEPDAVLYVRDYEDQERAVVPRAGWRFAREDAEEDAVIASREHVYLANGFEPGRIYELVYTTDRAPVVGCGLLAVRDIAGWLRDGAGDIGTPLERVYGWGMSQTGRMLRHFLFLGLNLDETGRMAYDGLMPHVGGARRGEFNQRFGQPSVQATPSAGFLPPFDDAGLLARQRELGGCPKLIQTNTSAEYWRGDCALMHIGTEEAEGEPADLPADPETRQYLFASTQHGPGAVPQTRVNPNDGGTGRYGFNTVDYSPLVRAALVNLDRWVSEGIEPPANAHPRIADGTAVSREEAVAGVAAAVPGLHQPTISHCLRITRVDPGERAGEGIASVPVHEGERYPTWVSAVDRDGNELAGVRLPDLTVPLAAHAGWNPRAHETGAPEQYLPMQGMSHVLPRTAEERAASGDPRAAILERYRSRDDYLTRVQLAARRLVSDRWVLEEDVQAIVSDALARWDDAFASPRS